jgi:hypothetical protein
VDGLGADVAIEAVGISETSELRARLMRPSGPVGQLELVIATGLAQTLASTTKDLPRWAIRQFWPRQRPCKGCTMQRSPSRMIQS